MAFFKLSVVVHEGRRTRRPLSSGRGLCFLAQIFCENSWFRGQGFLRAQMFVSECLSVVDDSGCWGNLFVSESEVYAFDQVVSLHTVDSEGGKNWNGET